MIVVAAVVALTAIAGAWIGWIIGSSELQRPHLDPLEPVFPDADSGERIYRRARFLRIVLAILGSLAGALAGFMFLFWLAGR
jgi:hypothetical protein